MDKEVSVNKPLTMGEFLSYMEAFEKRLRGKETKFITRQEIIKEIGITAYSAGVEKGYLTPIKNGARNSKVRIDRKEYKAYLEYLKR